MKVPDYPAIQPIDPTNSIRRYTGRPFSYVKAQIKKDLNKSADAKFKIFLLVLQDIEKGETSLSYLANKYNLTTKEIESLFKTAGTSFKEFTINDFKKQASTLTKMFRKARIGLLGDERKNSKLKKFFPNKSIFEWHIKPTYEDSVQIVMPKSNKFSSGTHYTLLIKLLELDEYLDGVTDLTKQYFDEILSTVDVKLFCNCSAFTYQGMRFQLTELESSVYPINIADPIWSKKHKGKHGLCKHLYGVLQNFNSYKPKMLKTIKKINGI